MVHNDLVLYGISWHGMVWYGMIWHGMVWYGVRVKLWGRKEKTMNVTKSNAWGGRGKNVTE